MRTYFKKSPEYDRRLSGVSLCSILISRTFILLITLCAFGVRSYGQSPTVAQYKTADQCYIKIYQSLTTDEARALRIAIDDAGYTNINISTQNGYKLTMDDVKLIFRQYGASADGNHPEATDNTNNTGNVNDSYPSVVPMYTCTTLSLKDADFADECFSSITTTTDYGNYVGHLFNLQNLTTSKTAQGPDMRGTNAKSTLVSMKMPKLGANDTNDKATATVGMFTGFTALTTIDLNTCAKGDIPTSAFQGCTALSQVKIMTTGLQTIGDYAFQGCSSLHKVSFPYGVTKIGIQSFANCDLTQLTLPITLETIAQFAFLSNTNLKTVRIPASVTLVESGAFNNNSSLDNVYLLGENTKAQASAFITNMTCDGFTYENTYNSNADYNGTFSKNHWTNTNVTTGTKSPVLLHVPNTDTARKRYLNPFLFFIDDDEALNALADIYKAYGANTIGYNTFDAKRNEWFATWSPKYPGNTVENYKWDIYNYMQARYVDPEKKVDIKTSSGETVQVDYWLTIRPWEIDSRGYRYPKKDASNQFNSPIHFEESADYQGWNQFLLAAPDAYESRDSVVIPTFTGDHWYSMCLPFPMTRAQIDEAFGGGTEVCEFTKVVKKPDGTITFYFTEKVVGNGVYTHEHHPYMIRPELTSATMPAGLPGQRVIYDVDINTVASSYPGSPTDESNMVKVPYYDQTNPENEIIHENAFTFYGNESEGQVIPGNRYFWAWNTTQKIGSFFHSAATMVKDIAWPKYTAIVKPENTDYASSAKGNMQMIDWVDELDTTTNLVLISADTKKTCHDNKVYNLNGQYVSDSLSGLQRGIYLLNGKKFVVR